MELAAELTGATVTENRVESAEGDHPWFALRVRSNFERTSALSLSQKGYETFLPTYQRRTRRWDRTVDVEVPLFPSYVFCRFDFHRRLPILMTPGVVHIVGNGSLPTPVSSEEISAVRAIVASNVGAERWPFLQVGQRVRITAGPLAGLEGILVQLKGSHRLVVSITLLQRSVAAVIDGGWVQPLPKSATTANAAMRPCAVACR